MRAIGQKRLRFNNDQRRRLAAKAKGLGRKLLTEVATIVTSRLAWHRRLIAQEYDGGGKRGRGRPRRSEEIEDLVVRMGEENRSRQYRRIQGSAVQSGSHGGAWHDCRDISLEVSRPRTGIVFRADDLVRRSAVWKAPAEFMVHYHSERNHPGLDNALICPEPEHAGAQGEVHRRERLGGLLNYLYRKAA